MNESHTKNPKFCKVHEVSNGVALHHVVTHFRITCKGDTPASVSDKQERHEILSNTFDWEAGSCCDNWSACGERENQQGFFCKMESSSLYSSVWTLTLVTTCYSAIVTQLPGVKYSCVLWQRKNWLSFQPRWSTALRNPQTHYCNGIPSDLLPSTPGHCKEINVHGIRSFPWALRVTVQSNSETCRGHWVHRVASGIFLNQKENNVLSQQPVADTRHQPASGK